jgi:hypothetical protein
MVLHSSEEWDDGGNVEAFEINDENVLSTHHAVYRSEFHLVKAAKVTNGHTLLEVVGESDPDSLELVLSLAILKKLEPDHLDAFPQAKPDVRGAFVLVECQGHRSVLTVWVINAWIVVCRCPVGVELVECEVEDAGWIFDFVRVDLGNEYTTGASIS